MIKLPDIQEPRRVFFGDEEQDFINNCIQELKIGQLNDIQLVSDFESQFAEFIKVKHVVATNSATSGLQIALQASGLKRGQEVIVTPYTFSATAHAIINAGGVPVFADIREDSLCLDFDDVESKITDKTFAIMAVHIGGKSENIYDLCVLAKQKNVLVFEDAAQAHGSTYRNQYVGTFGQAGVFSFGTKLMTSFKGGAIVTNNDEIAKICRSYIYHGISSNGQSPYTHEYPGYNFQMTGLQAALLIPQIKKLPERFEKRYQNGMYLKDKIEQILGLKVAMPTNGGTSNFYMFEMLYDKLYFSGKSRENLIKLLQKEGLPVLQANIIDRPIYENHSLRSYITKPCFVAESVYNHLIIIGRYIHSTLMDADQETLDLTAKKLKRAQDLIKTA